MARIEEQHIIGALSGASVEEQPNGMFHLKLPALDKQGYQKAKKLLEFIGGKWKGGNIQAHVFERNPKPLIENIVQSGGAFEINPLHFFPTSEADAFELLRLAELAGERFGSSAFPRDKSFRILEPSAGSGAIAKAVKAAQPEVTLECVELDPLNRSRLEEEENFTLIGDDFLQLDPDNVKPFDMVLMNPPFKKTEYIDHIEHALKFLKPCGELWAIAPVSFVRNSDKKSRWLFDMVAGHGEYYEMDSGSFKHAGTNVRTCMLKIEKPGTDRRDISERKSWRDNYWMREDGFAFSDHIARNFYLHCQNDDLANDFRSTGFLKPDFAYDRIVKIAQIINDTKKYPKKETDDFIDAMLAHINFKAPVLPRNRKKLYEDILKYLLSHEVENEAWLDEPVAAKRVAKPLKKRVKRTEPKQADTPIAPARISRPDKREKEQLCFAF